MATLHPPSPPASGHDIIDNKLLKIEKLSTTSPDSLFLKLLIPDFILQRNLTFCPSPPHSEGYLPTRQMAQPVSFFNKTEIILSTLSLTT